MSFYLAMKHLRLEPRAQQEAMITPVKVALTNGKVQFIQAGTGTGKSYVLLSEAVDWSKASGQPVVVVCPNNTLINQYVEKDAPRIAAALGARIEYIKGRGRYICANSNALRMEGFGKAKAERAHLALKMLATGKLEWAEHGLTDDWGCPGSRRCKPGSMCLCGAYAGLEPQPSKCVCPLTCGIQVARQRAESAHVVITNAHILVWDARIRQFTDGVFGLLPEYSGLFVDECHELEGVGRDVMSVEIGDNSKVWQMSKPIAAWRKDKLDEMRQSGEQEQVLDVLEDEQVALLGHVWHEMQKYSADSDERERLGMLAEFLTSEDGSISVVQLQPGSEPGEFKFVCQRRPIDVSWFFRDLLGAQGSVLVSGTIPPSDKRRLGVSKAKILYVGHPFDYSRSRLWIAPFDARDRQDLSPRIDAAADAIKAVNGRGGGTLLLFTSWTDLDSVTQALAGLLPDVEFWVQGREEQYAACNGSLRQDVEEFREAKGGVLAGVASLFTGLDLPGETLSQVVLWKLPYAVPTAEVRAIQDRFGQSVYQDQMMMRLVQGIGRLVRTTDDTGNVLIMDNRAARLNWSVNPMADHVAQFARL